MSGASWRFTDADGVERTVATDELRASLASGKLPPSTLVWREGMGEWQAAFTLPELSSAAIAAARRGSIPPGKDTAKRSVPPPLPARPAPRGVQRTLTGLEPPAMLEALGLNKRTDGAIVDAPTTDGGEESSPETRQLGSLDENEDWDKQTDLIPRAPGLPKDLRPLGLRPAPAAPASDPGTNADAKRTTLLGFGQKPAIGKVPSAQGQGIRAVAVGRGSIPPAGASAERSKPPPPLTSTTTPAAGTPVKKRSEPPPPPKRLNRTLEMTAVPASTATPAAASAKPPGPPNRPPRAAARITAQGGITAPKQEMRTTRPLSKHPPPPLKPRPAADATPAPGTVATATPIPATAKPAIADEPTRAVGDAAAAAADESPARVSNPDAPTKISTLSVAPTTQSSPTGTTKKEAEKPAASASARPVAEEKTDIIVKEAKPVGSSPKRERTIEMEIGDHSQAAAKDPASPASVRPKKTTTDRPPADSLKPRSSRSDSSRRSIETTDATASRDARDSESDVPRRKRKKSALEVPMSAVLAVSSVWVIGLVAFFFVGRVSGFKSAGKVPLANHGITDAFLLNAIAPAATPIVATDSEPKPCWVTRQPSRWAPSASKTVSFDMRPQSAGSAGSPPRETSMLLGFAVDDKKAAGLKIDPKTGKFEEIFKKETSEPIVRVAPRAGGTDFYVGEKADRTFLPVDAPSPFFLAFEKGQIGSAETPEGTIEPMWKLEGDDLVTAEQVLPVTDGYALAFRRGNDVSLGLFGADRKVKGEIAKLDSKGKNGKPRIGTNGTELAATFAVKAEDNDEAPWKLHVAKAAVGINPTVVELELAPGGPGGDAIAPDIIGLKDGRWLLMWTEGKSGERAIRAQTYDPSFEPIGDPIALSPPAGSFGQALLGVVGTYTTVVFLQAADEGFEMWGAVLQCGS